MPRRSGNWPPRQLGHELHVRNLQREAARGDGAAAQALRAETASRVRDRSWSSSIQRQRTWDYEPYRTSLLASEWLEYTHSSLLDRIRYDAITGAAGSASTNTNPLRRGTRYYADSYISEYIREQRTPAPRAVMRGSIAPASCKLSDVQQEILHLISEMRYNRDEGLHAIWAMEREIRHAGSRLPSALATAIHENILGGTATKFLHYGEHCGLLCEITVWLPPGPLQFSLFPSIESLSRAPLPEDDPDDI